MSELMQHQWEQLFGQINQAAWIERQGCNQLPLLTVSLVVSPIKKELSLKLLLYLIST
jgi:hypothetical protein